METPSTLPPPSCPCLPRIEALEALVQEQGRQIQELIRQLNEANVRVQNAAMSFFCDISVFVPQQNVNGPQVQQPVNLMEASGITATTTTTAESTATAASNEEESTGTGDFSSQNDGGGGPSGVAVRNVTVVRAEGTCTSPAPAPTQPPAFFGDVEIETKPTLNADGVIQTAKVSTSKKKRSSCGTASGSAAKTKTATATPTSAPATKKARILKLPARRFRCVDCTASYFDRIGLQIHSRIHEKNIFGLGPELKTCEQCGLQMLASEPAKMHSTFECEAMRQNRQKN